MTRPVFAVATPRLADVLLYLQHARSADSDEHDRLLGCARNVVQNHALLDWRTALTREGVDGEMVRWLLDP